MSLPPLAGHADARSRLAAAVAGGKLPQVLLITGPRGIGKQRLALWLAQRLACENAGTATEPCGRCRPCLQVLGLVHPDLHWLVPIPRPKASEPDKQVEEAGEAIGAVLAERRQTPLYGPPDGMAGHHMATVRLLLRRAAITAAQSGWKVFILGDADRLTAQEGAETSANALLKLLEEPPAKTLLVLTAADPRQLLPTIVSRAVPLRLGALDDATVDAFLAAQLPSLDAADRRQRVAAADGSIGAAIAGADNAPARQAAEKLLAAAMGGPAARAERALSQPAFAARGDFAAMLDALGALLGDAARASAGATPRGLAPASDWAERSPEQLLAAIEKVAAARAAANQNVNPQLLVAALQADLAEVL